jgi:hypothetical protein
LPYFSHGTIRDNQFDERNEKAAYGPTSGRIEATPLIEGPQIVIGPVEPHTEKDYRRQVDNYFENSKQKHQKR